MACGRFWETSSACKPQKRWFEKKLARLPTESSKAGTHINRLFTTIKYWAHHKWSPSTSNKMTGLAKKTLYNLWFCHFTFLDVPVQGHSDSELSLYSTPRRYFKYFALGLCEAQPEVPPNVEYTSSGRRSGHNQLRVCGRKRRHSAMCSTPYKTTTTHILFRNRRASHPFKLFKMPGGQQRTLCVEVLLKGDRNQLVIFSNHPEKWFAQLKVGKPNDIAQKC